MPARRVELGSPEDKRGIALAKTRQLGLASARSGLSLNLASH